MMPMPASRPVALPSTELVALEVDDTIQALHATAATAAGDTTMVVTTSLFGETFRKGPATFPAKLLLKARRGGFQLAHSHVYTPSKNSIFSPDARVT